MDEFNISSLKEAKGEYSIRLVNILTPCILEGIKSIFDNAKHLCMKQDEFDKYLMTFQNLLSRVVNWNEALIQTEVDRIVRKSQCSYIPELISSVHLTQVKVLTSVKLGNECKKISIEIPTMNSFIHNIYIKTARKLYSNVYLFEENVYPLDYQKYMRECEAIIQECILDTIRDGIPVEAILRSYLNDIEEVVEEKVESKQTTEPEVKTATEPLVIDTTKDAGETKVIDTTGETKVIDTTGETKVIDTRKEAGTATESSHADGSVKTTLLNFNNNDQQLDMGSNEIKNVNAPKNIERLDKLHYERDEQRKLEEAEEDDEDSLTIGETLNTNNVLNIENTNIKLDIEEL